MATLASVGAYRSWRGIVYDLLIARIIYAYAILTALIIAYLYFSKTSLLFSRLWFGIWLVSACLCAIFIRIIAYWLLTKLRRAGRNIKTVALFGTREACRDIYRAVHRDKLSGFHINEVHLLDDDDAPFANVDEIARFNPATEYRPNCHEIWLCLPLSEGDAFDQIMHSLRFSSANIRLLPDLRGFRLINHRASYVVGYYALDLSISPMLGWQSAIKWIEDKLVALIAMVILIPVTLILGLWILLVDGLPIFYRQPRVGWNGEIFTIVKYRTMRNRPENDQQWGNASHKPTIPLGRLLRRFSIDELPQFWNVLKGDMSVVGPRPEQPQYVEKFKEEIPGYMKKHMVKAGVTGWAQVNGWRGDTDLQQRINHDLWYIENWSLWLDLKIICLTIIRTIRHPSE